MNISVPEADDGVSVSIFHDEIPADIGPALSARYESLHASLPFFRAYRSLDKASCYVARGPQGVLEVFVFRIQRRRALVLNEMLRIAPEELARFVRTIFDTFRQVDVISFEALDCGDGRLAHPIQRFNAKDTFAIPLPATAEAYTAALGKTTRTSIRHQLNTLNRSFASVTMRFLDKDQIDRETLHAIARLSEDRIAARGARYRHDIERTRVLAAECGFVSLLCVDGKMCAGSVNYQVGRNFFGDITAYEPAYGRYGVGKLCTYLTICESIRRGGAKFFLGGGEFEFKQRLLGQRMRMDQMQVYRSRYRMLANLDCACSAFAQGQVRRLKVALHQHKGTRAGSMTYKVLQALKSRFAKVF